MLKSRFESKIFFYGYWNSYGISQDQPTMNRGCKVESYSNKYFPNTSLTKTCQPLCLDDNKKDRSPTMDHCNYSLFLAIFLRNCRNHSFCWTPLYLLCHLNLVILAKTAISAIFFKFWRNCRNRSFCRAPWYLL